MAETWQRHSPLARHMPLDDADAGLSMAERPFLAKITLRGTLTDDALGNVAGLSLPRQPNTAADGKDHAILWLGPDEWLIIGPAESEAALSSALLAALPGVSIIDVTEGYATIRLGGTLVEDILAMGTPLDLHPRNLARGAATRTLFARTTIVLHKITDDPVFDIHVERSQANYLWIWLEAAARPYL